MNKVFVIKKIWILFAYYIDTNEELTIFRLFYYANIIEILVHIFCLFNLIICAMHANCRLCTLRQASYYDRSDIHLPGFRKFFLGLSNKTRTDSRTIVDYINIRGGYQQFGVINVSTYHYPFKKKSLLMLNVFIYLSDI